jgi:hypothetical protein
MKKSIGGILFLSCCLTAFILIGITSCTKNQRVKKFGGTATIELPIGQKLIHCTWKDANLWYLTRPMTKTDTAEIYTFQEKSNLGIVQGAYIIKEKK